MFRDLLMSLGLLHIEISAKDGKRIEYIKGSIEDIENLIEKSKPMSNITEQITQFEKGLAALRLETDSSIVESLLNLFAPIKAALQNKVSNVSAEEVLFNRIVSFKKIEDKNDEYFFPYKSSDEMVKQESICKVFIGAMQEYASIVNERKDSVALIEKSRIEGILTGLKICKEMWAQGTISHENIYENEVYYKEELKNIQ